MNYSCIPSLSTNAIISFGLAVASFSVGAMGAFAVYRFVDMSLKLVVLALVVGQLFATNFFFAFYTRASDRNIRVSVPGESPNRSPEDSPQREGLRRSQELNPGAKPEGS
jgi:hypothetical protein